MGSLLYVQRAANLRDDHCKEVDRSAGGLMISKASPPGDRTCPSSRKGAASAKVAKAIPTDKGPKVEKGVCDKGSSESTQNAPGSMTNLEGSSSAGRAGGRRLVPPAVFLGTLDWVFWRAATCWDCSSGSTN